MSSSDDVANILFAYAERSGGPRVEFRRLSVFARRYVEHHLESNPALEDLDENLDNLLAVRLIELEENNRCDIEYQEGRIVGVYYPEFFLRKLNRLYARVRERPVLPFPSDDSLDFALPSQFVRPVDVTSGFVQMLKSPPDDELLVLRLLFPDGIRSVLIPATLIGDSFALLLLQKIRNYLRTSQNAGYLQSRLQTIFPNRDLAVKEVIDKAMTTPEDALATITKPTDFSFRLWTSFSTVIIKEFAQKTEPLSEDHDHAQAAYLLGYFAVHYNSIRQEAKDHDAALKAVENGFQREPYAYTASQISQIKDSHGVPVSKRCSTSEIHRFIAQKMKPSESNKLPDILRLKTPDGTEYYLARNRVIPVLLRRRKERSQELHAFYLNSWSDLMRSERSVTSMTDEDAFSRDVEEQLQKRDPLLMGLLSYTVISTALQDENVSETAVNQVMALIDSKKQVLHSLPEILGLEREKLYRDARLTLPIWQAVPFLYALVRFSRFLFGPRRSSQQKRNNGKKREAKPPSTTGEAFTAGKTARMRIGHDGENGRNSGVDSDTQGTEPRQSGSGTEALRNRDAKIKYQKAVRELQREYTGAHSSVNDTLEELIERWNPLIDPKAKKDLVEDVNALVRDFLRRMKTGLKSYPPDRRRIQNLAANLCEKDALKEIRRREPLQRYVELYMLRILEK